MTYRRADGDAIWRATPDGAEEWLLLDAGAARAGSVAAAWEIEGAKLREVAGVIEILDGDGDAAGPRDGARRVGRRRAPGAGDALGARAAGSSSSSTAEARRCSPIPRWSATGTMLVPRGYHAAALLPNGAVFVAGGATSGATLGGVGALRSGHQRVVGGGADARRAHGPRSLRLLADGRVLVAGTIGAPTTAPSSTIPAPTPGLRRGR